MSEAQRFRKGRIGSMVRARYLRYGVLLIAGVLVVWVPTITYVLYAPAVYRSSWSILIPGAGVGSSLNLDSVGQASTSVASPYASQSVDPKVNYKAIATSSTVLGAAARRIGTDRNGFGKPRIKLVDQTSIMQVVLESDTAEGAYARSSALHESLEAELDRLRADEREQVQSGNLEQLDSYRDQVADAQQRLLEFQADSRTVSSEQLGTRLQTIQRLSQRRDELNLQIASEEGRRDALRQTVGVDAVLSSHIITLQQDKLLRDLLASYSDLSADHTVEAAVLGRRNPKVAAAASRVAAAREAIDRRAENLLGFSDTALVDRFLPAHDDGANAVHNDLIGLEVSLASARSEIEALDTLLADMKDRVADEAVVSARLKELDRGYRVAETIFLSALAKLDLGKSDIYASYPMTQILVEPELPTEPEKLGRLFAVLGAVVGSGFLVLSLGILWKRDALLRKLRKKG